MGTNRIRAAGMAQISTTALAAILTGVGVALLGLFVGLAVLLVRAIKNHKRLLADLEERGVVIAQAQAESKRESTKITKPRTVLKRTAILPFNKKSGWGALPSVESISPPEPTQGPAHYVPPKPIGFVSKPSRLSWPFSGRRASSKAIHMRKIRVPILSTVIESPKPSPHVPVLSGSLGGDLPSSKKSGSRPSSEKSLLQSHPAFRNDWQDRAAEVQSSPHAEPLRRSLTAKPIMKTEPCVLPNRSRSVADFNGGSKPGPIFHPARPRLHARSTSMCSQASGHAPESPMPPLPLEVARLKSQERRRSMLSRSPSQFSVSSFESAGSSILATQSSPILPRPGNVRVQKVSKRDWRNSMVVEPRHMRHANAHHSKSHRPSSSINSNAARISMGTQSTLQLPQAESRSSLITNSSSMHSINLKTAESVTLSKVTSPSCSPLTVRSYTPRRKSGSQVTAYGSPEERSKARLSGNHGVPSRQLSQTSTQASSTRSSNGNPFQWDPAPVSFGKPSALKGSPNARKGYRGQNCVRISLAPTILGPPSRSPSLSIIHGIQEESPGGTTEQQHGSGPDGQSQRSLPRLPSSSVFAPDLKITTTSIHASLTQNSPTLSMPDYNQDPIGSRRRNSPDRSRDSPCSVFTIPTFPSPCHGLGDAGSMSSPPPTFALSRHEGLHHDSFERLDSPMTASSPFHVILPEFYDAPEQPLLADEYSPEHPHLVYQTPQPSPPVGGFSSTFSTIPEESPATTLTPTISCQHVQHEDSPPCSPKTMRLNSHLDEFQNSFPQYSVQQSTIPEETPLECIDPAILTNDPFSMLASGFESSPKSSIVKTKDDGRARVPLPQSPGSAKTMLEPLIDAALPSTRPTANGKTTFEPRTTLSIHSSPSSLYSSHSPPPSPGPCAPCSPRPRHAELPAPSLNFTSIPTLSPTISGPRGSPPRPLRTSIAKLRRMNSDAEKEGKDKAGRGERRYLRLGREASIALPGDESYLDELENPDEEESMFDEEKGKMLVGSLLDWEEEANIMNDQDKKQNVEEMSSGANQGAEFSVNHRSRVQEQNKSMQQPPSSPRSNIDRSSTIDQASSIWEDGERFWHSTPPHPPNSPNKPRNNFVSLSPSPASTPSSKTSSRKREFEVAKDSEPLSPTESENVGNRNYGRKIAGGKHRKRNALGIGTPNVTVAPSPVANGTPGSLYDADGFLRA